MRTWVEISAGKLAHNFGAIARAACEAEVLAVVKADAYGHGAELCAPVLARAGARWFGVTDAAEGARVRLALGSGFGSLEAEPEVLVMSGALPEDTAAIAEHRLTPVVWTGEQVAALREVRGLGVHLEIDTGMSRQGARPGADLAALLEAVRGAGLTVEGVFTHLCSSEVVGSAVTAEQQERFAGAVGQVREAGVRPRWVHVANSSAVDCPSSIPDWLAAVAASVDARMMVRSGIALYGYALRLEAAPGMECREPRLRPGLQPVLTWKARVLAVREISAGDAVGYGATFVATEPMRVALLPVGYADGLRRELSNPGPTQGAGQEAAVHAGGWVMGRSPDGAPRRCPIVGRVSMNLTVVDIGAAPTVAAGDVVTILGEGVTADDHARVAGTIAYEVLCGLRCNGRRLVD